MESRVNTWIETLPEAASSLDNAPNREIGKDEEFERRLADCSGLAYRVALGVLRNPADAEDVAQEALVRAYRHFPELRERERFRAWLVRTVWRLAIDRQLLSYGGSGESHGHMFGRRLNILRDGLARLEGALEKAADRILRHLASRLGGFSEGTDFGNSRNKNAITAFGQRLQQYRVKVLVGLALA